MNMKIWIPILVVVIAGGALLYVQAGKNQAPAKNPVIVSNPNIQVSQPVANSTIASPLNITGQAKGTWYFEASFPIKIYNSSNVLIGQTVGQAQGNWMTTSFVPFTATLTFPAQTPGSSGTIVFEKDNPSGELTNADSYAVNITF